MTAAPIPVFRAFREQIGYKNTENKAESGFPVLNTGNFSTWPGRFEEWLSDTLPFKTQFIELYRGFQFRSGLDFSQSDVIRGKEGQLFYRRTVDNYKGLVRFTEEELEIIRQNLSGFFSMMKSMGTECMFYIAPDKEQVYAELMPDSILRVNRESRADQVVSALENRVSFPVLYPKSDLIRLSREHPVYFVTDTHWNELGGNIAAQHVRAAFHGEEISAVIPAYHYYDEKGKDLAGMLGLSDVMNEDNAVLVDFSDGIKAYKAETTDHGQVRRHRSDAPTHKKMLVIGDSFSEAFLRSAIHDIDEILFAAYGELSKIDLEAEAPDYLVVMLVERNLPFLLGGFY